MVFVKGKSGNPGGRPKKAWTWAGLLDSIANEVEPKTGKQYKELVSRRLWIEAINGNLIAVKEIFNRMEGMPGQHLDHTTAGQPLPQPIYGGKSADSV